ncbi:glycosyltransferase [Patescibacteria group bacterium]|nr:glycosyltransferase [Patescibacteria group bacterium]
MHHNKTIGIPAYNEGKSIARAINTILPQLGTEDEVLVVASGCTDNTTSIVNRMNDPRIKIIIQKEKRGKVSAINIILRKAAYSHIILADADVIVAPHAIAFLQNQLTQKHIGAVSARVVNFKEDTFFDKVQGFGWNALHDQKVMENKRGTFYALNGFLAGVKKDIVAPLDEASLVDDAILGWEVKQKGYRVVYEPRSHVYVKAAQNLSDYVLQKKRVRIGWWQMTEKGMSIKERRNLSQLSYLLKDIYAWPYITLDLAIWLQARNDFKKKKLAWEQVSSSKI